MLDILFFLIAIKSTLFPLSLIALSISSLKKTYSPSFASSLIKLAYTPALFPLKTLHMSLLLVLVKPIPET